MFRRRRNGPRIFSRNIALDFNQAVAGGETPQSLFIDTPVLAYQTVLNQEALTSATPNYANIIKVISVKGISWSSDVIFVGNATFATQLIRGAECWYVDRAETGLASAASLSGNGRFLDINQTETEWDPASFPERILHRRRFSCAAFAASVGSPESVAVWTAGFGTERAVRRKFSLKPNQALYYRIELYDVDTTASGSSLDVIGSVLGVLSYAIVV